MKKEQEQFSETFQEITPGKAIIEADYKKVIIQSSTIESVSYFIGLINELKELSDFNFKLFIKPENTFKVKSKNRQICIELGQIIKDNTKSNVSLDEPEYSFVVEELDTQKLIYLEIRGATKLNHRNYSVSNNEFITSDYARAIVESSEWKDNGVLLDPFCHEGYIIIEAILRQLNVGVGYFKGKELDFEVSTPKVKKIKSEIKCYSIDMSEIKFAKQNIKLSKLSKYVRFGFHDLEDLDFKIKEETIDYIITALPKKLDVDKLFFQLEYIMKKTGKITLFTNHEIKQQSEKYGFKIINKKQIGAKTIYNLVKA